MSVQPYFQLVRLSSKSVRDRKYRKLLCHAQFAGAAENEREQFQGCDGGRLPTEPVNHAQKASRRHRVCDRRAMLDLRRHERAFQRAGRVDFRPSGAIAKRNTEPMVARRRFAVSRLPRVSIGFSTASTSCALMSEIGHSPSPGVASESSRVTFPSVAGARPSRFSRCIRPLAL